MSDIMKRLQEPFPPDDIEWRVGSTNKEKTKGLALAYVTNRAIQKRLDEIFGPFGWKNDYREWKNNSQLCGISIKHEGEWITKWDGADDSNMEAVKGGLSDAMKRAAYQWGIGRYLYEIPQTWVALKQVGNSYVLAETPKLPAWALPAGHKQDAPKQPPQQAPQKSQNQPEQKAETAGQQGDITQKTIKALHAIRGQIKKTEDDFKAMIGTTLKREIKSLKDLSEAEAKALIKALNQKLQKAG